MRKRIIRTILHQNKDIYNKAALHFSDTRKNNWPGFSDFAKYVKSGDQVLDLGCGNGRMSQIFKNDKVDYLGLDNSAELIKIARRQNKGKNIKFKLGELTDLKLPANKFDLILMIAVFHHLPSRKLRLKVLRDVYKILKPGGRLVMSNWNLLGNTYHGRFRKHLWDYKIKIKNGLWSVKDALVPWKRGGFNKKRYVHSFTKGEMKRLIKQAGFKIEEIYYEKQGQKMGLLTSGNLLTIAVKK